MEIDDVQGTRAPVPVGAKGRNPLAVALGLSLEYAMFASAVFLALLLFATRVPLRLLDRVFGFRLRERVVDFLAWVSPG